MCEFNCYVWKINDLLYFIVLCGEWEDTLYCDSLLFPPLTVFLPVIN